MCGHSRESGAQRSASQLSVGVLTALDLDLFASYTVTVAAVEDLTQRLNRADLVVVNARGKLNANPLFRMRENAVATIVNEALRAMRAGEVARSVLVID